MAEQSSVCHSIMQIMLRGEGSNPGIVIYFHFEKIQVQVICLGKSTSTQYFVLLTAA